ncbi:hypothetical protein B0H13DRAFT_1918179 [Mycena leptocephala]|nr:hypothetical protein B0H13DRAFT_1918179 [Mycena leptocephala]
MRRSADRRLRARVNTQLKLYLHRDPRCRVARLLCVAALQSVTRASLSWSTGEDVECGFLVNITPWATHHPLTARRFGLSAVVPMYIVGLPSRRLRCLHYVRSQNASVQCFDIVHIDTHSLMSKGSPLCSAQKRVSAMRQDHAHSNCSDGTQKIKTRTAVMEQNSWRCNDGDHRRDQFIEAVRGTASNVGTTYSVKSQSSHEPSFGRYKEHRSRNYFCDTVEDRRLISQTGPRKR